MTRRTAFCSLGVFLLSVGTSRLAQAQTSCGTDCYLADSCERADVQAAIDAAVAANGGTVEIPNPVAASCDWTETVQVDATLHPLAVRGQSQETTHIRASVQAFDVAGGEGIQWALSDLKLSDAACTGTCDSLIGMGGGDQGRVHHLRFETTGVFTRLFRTYGATFGLIDHVTVVGTTPSEFVTTDDEGFPAWKRPADLGSARAVYIEDCDISFADSWEGRPFDGENGGRMVVRHNQVENQILGSHGLDSGYGASIFSVVAYENSFTLDDTNVDWSSKTWARLTHFRGGTGLLYANTWTIGADIWIGSPNIDLAIYRNATDAGGNEHWLPCDGTQYRMCSNIAEDWSVTSGDYPYNCASDQDCIDKLGAGTTCKWKLCSKSKLELCELDTDCPSGETCTEWLDGPAADGYPCYMQPGFGTHMQRHPWYEWGNTWSGAEGGSSCASPPCDVDFGEDVTPLEEGRDYLNDVPTGTTLPSGACTPYAGFFHTGEHTLYRCDESGAWQSYYVEFPYPHPLQGGASGGTGGSSSGGSAGSSAAAGNGGLPGTGGSNPSGGPSSEDDSGCGCTIPSRRAHEPFTLLILALLCRARRKPRLLRAKR